MILFHILMFSQNSTFYIYIIYCQNAPWSGCLLGHHYFSFEREKSNLKKKKKNRSTEQIRLFHKIWVKFASMGCVDKCFCVCASRLNRNCTFIEKYKHKCVTRQKSSWGFDFTKPYKICDTKFASKGIPKLNHFYTKVICILNCIDCPTLSYYPSCSFREFFLPLPRLVLPG